MGDKGLSLDVSLFFFFLMNFYAFALFIEI